ncbi:MAG TPA: hypothetical protein VGO25_08955 [Rhodanobacteraceae bacterium]|nr:hypothetical protein [Rhodanobacteraceae bacterium]
MKASVVRCARGALITSILCAGLFARASAQDVRYCEVAFDFNVQGKPIAAQSTIVEFGQPKDITIDKPDLSGAWQFRIVVDPPTMIRRAVTIPIDIEIYEITAGQSYLRAAPHIGAVPGQHADLQMIFGDDDGRRARIGLVANPRSDAEAQALIESEHDAAPDEPDPPR